MEGFEVCQTLGGDRAKYPTQGRGVWRAYQLFLANPATCNKSKHPPRRHSASQRWGIRCTSVTMHERGRHQASSGTDTSGLSAVWKFIHPHNALFTTPWGPQHHVHAPQQGKQHCHVCTHKGAHHVAHSRKIQSACRKVLHMKYQMWWSIDLPQSPTK